MEGMSCFCIELEDFSALDDDLPTLEEDFTELDEGFVELDDNFSELDEVIMTLALDWFCELDEITLLLDSNISEELESNWSSDELDNCSSEELESTGSSEELDSDSSNELEETSDELEKIPSDELKTTSDELDHKTSEELNSSVSDELDSSKELLTAAMTPDQGINSSDSDVTIVDPLECRTITVESFCWKEEAIVEIYDSCWFLAVSSFPQDAKKKIVAMQNIMLWKYFIRQNILLRI